MKTVTAKFPAKPRHIRAPLRRAPHVLQMHQHAVRRTRADFKLAG